MTTAATTAKTKYRPSLTVEQIRQILNLARLENPISNVSISIIATLTPVLAKIEVGTLTASYVPAAPAPSLTMLEAIGAASSDSTIAPSHAAISKETYWEACYQKLIATPLECSIEEIEAAREHKYLNDLMTPEEIVEFEAGEFTAYNQ